jgi:hypothetical protein
MSLRISFMASRPLMQMPPVSKVIPLPTSTTCRRAPRGRQASSTTRGPFAEPPPTASTPPNPSAVSCSGSRTVTVTPGVVLPSRVIRRASHAGVFRSLGVFVRSLASIVMRAATRACSTAAAVSGESAPPRPRGTRA